MATRESDDDQSPWSKTPFILASTFLVVVVVLAAWLAFGRNSNHPAAAASTQATLSGPTATATSKGPAPTTKPAPTTSPPSTHCDLASNDQQVPQMAPTGITWQLWQGVALPFSSTAGPEIVRGDVARCYAHTPLGALIAAVQIQYRFLVSNDWEPIVYRQMMPGPGRAVLVSLEKTAAAIPGPPTPPGGYDQIAAFLFVTYTRQVAVIELVTQSDEGGMVVGTYSVEWSHGDWRLALQPDGHLTPAVQTVTSVVDYVMWGGV
jgi:hypothetical protein